ncbi:MAG TPA: hypothetical protein VHO26_07985 [Propionibacteriaceae bacterium]|nr:hypothetical protein [Propionibacteriaceae bacterium]
MARIVTPDSHDFPTRRYDLVKEFVVALVVMALLVVVFAVAVGSPDEKAITMKSWAANAPADVVATATSELAGTSTTAGYGPPYNSASDGQALGPLTLAKWIGITQPVDAANDLVITPVSTLTDSATQQAVQQWKAASADQQGKWANNYADALSKAPDGDPAKVAKGDYGPVPAIAQGELTLAKSGALEGLLTTSTTFFGTNPTKALLLLADGSYMAGIADSENLSGDQWGMMNETGHYPGQPWLWLYTFWYQIPPFSTSDNADVQVWALMILLSLVFALIPWIPGLNRIPRGIKLYRLVWRNWYRKHPETMPSRAQAPPRQTSGSTQGV